MKQNVAGSNLLFFSSKFKLATTVHLPTNSSEITVVSNLNETYSSEGVTTLNVASKVEFPIEVSLIYADFWPFS